MCVACHCGFDSVCDGVGGDFFFKMLPNLHTHTMSRLKVLAPLDTDVAVFAASFA